MKARNNRKQWKKTSTKGLYLNCQSKGYYSRLFGGGKEKWEPLDTTSRSIAERKLAEKKREAGHRKRTVLAVKSGKGTMGDLARIYLERVDANEDLKESSKKARRAAVARIRRTWDQFDSLSPERVTLSSIVDWTTRLKRGESEFTPPNARRALNGNSATSINTAVDALRRILDIAVEQGTVFSNVARQKPPEGRLKKRVSIRRVSLPALADVHAVFEEIESGSGIAGRGVEIADFCRFLAFTGLRVGEARKVRWRHIDWPRNQIEIHGYKTESSDRILPLFPPLAELLTKIKQRRRKQARVSVDGEPYVPPEDPILIVGEALKSIARACDSIGVRRLTHHDFRHAFTTVAIESGVPIPTVARWLGHKDGGALLMKTYAHLRDEHSQAAALLVTWEPKTAEIVPMEQGKQHAGA